jgi:hypothetical protein
MNDPIKIIWKYKNDNRRVQYNTYIFIGNQVPLDIQKSLDKIINLNFYDAIITLNKTEYKKLEDFYGLEWYNTFFNTYHVHHSIQLIKESSTQKTELLDKFGDKWYEKHISNKQLIDKKILYSYESIIKDDRLRKIIKKGRSTSVVETDDGQTDFTLQKKIDVNKLFSKHDQKRESKNVDLLEKAILEDRDELESELESDISLSDTTDSSSEINELQSGGNYCMECGNRHVHIINDGKEDNYEFKMNYDETYSHQVMGKTQFGAGVDDQDTDDDNNTTTSENTNDEDENDEALSETSTNPFADDYMSEEEMDIDEIEKMYKDSDVNPDQDITETAQLIKKALNDENLFEKKLKTMIDFDQSKDTNIYDEHLRDVFKKIYVKTQYIFKDDTIKDIRNKICCGIKMNSKFGELYLSPSRQYFWSEYWFENTVKKIMIGQKWMRKNEVLQVDIEPDNNFRKYEELRNQLKQLRESMRRYNNKIRNEDDNNDILYDYGDYITSNELYMIDVYNELGMGYTANVETVKNIQDVYLKIYFPKIKSEDIKTIIDLLNGQPKSELSKVAIIFDTINNDITMENEITGTVEEVKMKNEYRHIFKENFITQSVIHLNLRISEGKLNLFRIFNEFIVNNEYPFVQYQTADGNIIYKFNEKEINDHMKSKDDKNVLVKWFENAPYGISFKVKVQDKTGVKFMAIGLNENGRIEYKTQWKEEDMATINDIKNTYSYIKNLINKINDEKNKVKIDLPYDSEFKFAFINTIQKFILPNNYIINHNDLSHFSRYFYPYVALVIEPRKRQAKIPKHSDKSKFGTYLRYKRVSKYENQARIEQRIMYFIRNFEFTEKALSNEISKQFNITEEKALEEYERVRQRYPNLKKSRKVLKKLENIPKYKPPGIGIDIQGKQPEKYKIRISGARDREQLERIINFMNILIYLYVETYHFKTPDKQILKKKLEQLKNIAERRSKVDDIVNYSKEIKNVKAMTQLDKRRIGFKPEQGQNQWTRSCQNSGNDKKRRPQQYSSTNMEDLIKQGYFLNKKTGNYEKKVMIKGKGGKKTEITIKTVKMSEFDETGNMTGNEIHYGCNPAENGDHFYIGFLTRSTNPHGHCMPCCFKKDPTESKNKEKQDFFNQCLGHTASEKLVDNKKPMGERLYILQDTNKIQEGRLASLPTYLEIYFNYALNKQKKIKHHYLLTSETGYFFKYGSKQDEYQFINAICSLFDLTIEQLKDKVTSTLEKDKSNQIFTSLNCGDIKTQFVTRNEYINKIKSNDALNYEMLNNIISLPKVLTKDGLNLIIFQKRNIIIKRVFEKEKIREDFILQCQDPEDVVGLKNNKDCVFIIKENKNYYPIVMALKDDENSKTMDIIKVFRYEEKKTNIIYHISDFYDKNCTSGFIDVIVHENQSLTAKVLKHILTTNKIKYQYVDVRNKCKYLILQNELIIPVRPSGPLFDVPIIKSIDKFIKSFKETWKLLVELHNTYKGHKNIPVEPIGIYYDNFTKTSVTINAIMTTTQDIVPVKAEDATISNLEKDNMLYENRPLTDKVDNEILKGKSNFVVDDRITQVILDEYKTESYELFRLEFSEYVNKKENAPIKAKIEAIVINNEMKKHDKIDKLKLLIFRLVDKELYATFKNLMTKRFGDLDDEISDQDIQEIDDNTDAEQTGGKYDKLITISKNIPDLKNYQISNDRIVCKSTNTKDKCNKNPHCKWTQSGCYMSLIQELVISFVNKISDELAQNELKAVEILQVEGYFVSDIVDHNKFTERPEQKIIRSTSNIIKKVLNETFGADTGSVKIGRRKTLKSLEINYQQLNANNPMIDLKTFYIQKVLENNLSLFRAYVNCYYWLKNKYNDVENRNIGYYSPLQTDLANYYRSLVIDWLNDNQNEKTIQKNLVEYMDVKKNAKNPTNAFILKISKDVHVLTSCIVELYILSKINKIPIVVYDDYNNPLHIFVKGMVYNSTVDKQIPSEYLKYIKAESKSVINLRFLFITNTKIPDDVESLYFKD